MNRKIKHKSLIIILLTCVLPNFCLGQFSPQVGRQGCEAIQSDSSIITNWFTKVHSVQLGYQSLADTSLGLANSGIPDYCLGKADHLTLSLGDGGSIVLETEGKIFDGNGFDLVVFENGFSFGSDSNFLELAFVEVSSDGQNFVRFPASSQTDTNFQVGTFGSLEATQLNHLAGKYVGSYGTPFDLNVLKDFPLLDIQNIRFIRIIDVVGSIQKEYASRDHLGWVVNDPWPTPFPSSGFDLDAIGIIHGYGKTFISEIDRNPLLIFPNPITIGESVYFQTEMKINSIKLTDLSGKTILQQNITGIASFEMPINEGIYFLRIETDRGIKTQKILVQTK